jgi:integrase
MKRNGSWFIRYKDNVIEDGAVKRRLMFKKLDVPDDREHRSEASVRAIATKFLLPINEGTQDVRSTMTLVDFVENVYIPEHVATLRPASQRQYKGVWKLYVKPRVLKVNSDITLRGFRTVDGETILKRIAKETEAARSSLLHAKAFLSGCFSEALRLGILDSANPMTPTKVPKRPATEPTHAYSMEEIERILKVLPEPSKAVVLVAAFTGLRKSELWGLRWEDFDGNSLRVQRSIWNGHTSEPKTEASKASIPIIAQLADALEDHRERMGKLAEGPIFQADNGSPLNLDNLVRRFIVPALNRCKTCRKPLDKHPTEGHMPERDTSLPEWFGWHAFRRGLATNLNAMGVDDKTIQAILRHESVETTRGIYIKSVPKSATEAMDRLSQGLTFTKLSLEPAKSPVSSRTGRTQ